MLFLIRENHNDSIRMGDGERIIRLYRYMFLFYRISSCPKYAFGTSETIAQTIFLLSPRKAYDLIWNSFANSQGKADSSHLKRSKKDDILVLVDQISNVGRCFEKHPGRQHESFPNFSSDILSSLDMEKTVRWMRNSMRTYLQKHFYQWYVS